MIKKWCFISRLTTRPGSPEKVLQSKISLECQRRKKTSHEASKDAVKQKKKPVLTLSYRSTADTTTAVTATFLISLTVTI